MSSLNTKVAFESHNKLKLNLWIKILDGISQLLCLTVPNLYNYNGLSVWYLLYSLTFVALLYFLLVWNVKLKIDSYYRIIDKTSTLDVLVMFSYSFINSFIILHTVFFRRKSLILGIRQLEELYNAFNLSPYINKSKTFVIFGASSHLKFAAILVVVVSFHFLRIEQLQALLHVHTLVNLYIIIINTLQIINYCHMLETLFYNLNKNLKFIITKNKHDINKPVKMEAMLKLHDKLCDAQHSFNDVLGLPIILLCGLVTLNCLQTINLILEFKLSLNEVSIDVHLSDVLVSVAITGILLSSMFSIGYSTNRSNRESHLTHHMCQQILIEFSTTNRNVGVTQYSLQLYEQLKYRNPYFIAAHCFIVDVTIISRIVGMVLAHVVMLLQFD
ncbi:hypothetical protein FQR65_LT04089 [Abscondita terminalis]|nr:hypothetical protein FQR65_LT04089 [Abscondita terminalis]